MLLTVYVRTSKTGRRERKVTWDLQCVWLCCVYEIRADSFMHRGPCHKSNPPPPDFRHCLFSSLINVDSAVIPWLHTSSTSNPPNRELGSSEDSNTLSLVFALWCFITFLSSPSWLFVYASVFFFFLRALYPPACPTRQHTSLSSPHPSPPGCTCSLGSGAERGSGCCLGIQEMFELPDRKTQACRTTHRRTRAEKFTGLRQTSIYISGI